MLHYGMSRYTFQCRQCGREFSASRRDAKRYSSSCRVYAFRNIPHHGTFGVADRSQLEVSRPIKSSMTSPNFIEASPSEILKMNMEEAIHDPDRSAAARSIGAISRKRCRRHRLALNVGICGINGILSHAG